MHSQDPNSPLNATGNVLSAEALSSTLSNIFTAAYEAENNLLLNHFENQQKYYEELYQIILSDKDAYDSIINIIYENEPNKPLDINDLKIRYNQNIIAVINPNEDVKSQMLAIIQNEEEIMKIDPELGIRLLDQRLTTPKIAENKVETTKAETIPPKTTKPVIDKIEASELDTVKLKAARLKATRLKAAKLKAAEWKATRLKATKPETTKPETTKPETTKLEAAKAEEYPKCKTKNIRIIENKRLQSKEEQEVYDISWNLEGTNDTILWDLENTNNPEDLSFDDVREDNQLSTGNKSEIKDICKKDLFLSLKSVSTEILNPEVNDIKMISSKDNLEISERS